MITGNSHPLYMLPEASGPLATFTVQAVAGELVVRDDNTWAVLGRVPSDVTITERTDSWDCVEHVRHMLPGQIVGIDHDCGELLVCCRID